MCAPQRVGVWPLSVVQGLEYRTPQSRAKAGFSPAVSDFVLCVLGVAMRQDDDCHEVKLRLDVVAVTPSEESDLEDGVGTISEKPHHLKILRRAPHLTILTDLLSVLYIYDRLLLSIVRLDCLPKPKLQE